MSKSPYCSNCQVELSLSEIENGEGVCNDCYRDFQELDHKAMRGIVNAVRLMSHFLLWLAVMYLLTGCGSVRPLADYSHLSHTTQHYGDNQTNYGFDILSGGIRWRPTPGVTIDLLEGYSKQEMHGRHEVFTGRVTVEF